MIQLGRLYIKIKIKQFIITGKKKIQDRPPKPYKIKRKLFSGK